MKTVNGKWKFNLNWTNEQIKSALNYVCKEALNNGVTTGKYTITYSGEQVTAYLEEGVFKAGYGNHIYTYDELIKLIGDE